MPLRRLTGLLLALPLVAGCLEDFDPPWLIEESRVLAGRAEPEGDPARAWPRPGERVRVPWLVAHPEEARPLQSLFVVCPAAPTSFGVGFCAGDPVPTEPCSEADPQTPCASFEVPGEAELGDAEQLLMLGGICADGRPIVDPEMQTFECRGEEAAGAPVAFTIPLQRGEPVSQHPRIADVRFDDGAWPPLPEAERGVSTEGCTASDALPAVSPGGEPHELELAMEPGSLEPYVVLTVDGDEEMRTEEMRVAHFTTAGELERQFTIIERQDEPAVVEWTAPPASEVPEAGLLVRFHFVVRDGRAGIAWTHRGLCVR